MTIIEIVHPVTAIVGVSQAPGSVVGVAPVVGPAGPQGPAGDSIAFEYVQATPLATWVVPVPPAFGRRPAVTTYRLNGTRIYGDVTASSTQVSVQWTAPIAGVVVCT